MSGKKIEIDYDLELKRCSKCGDMLPFYKFFKNASIKSGLAGACKVCSKIKTRRVPLKNLEINYDLELKSCSKCGEVLSFSEFSKDSGQRSGLNSACRSCCRVARGSPPLREFMIDYDLEVKRCPSCTEILAFSAFTKDRNQKSGLRPSCKECCRIANGHSPLNRVTIDYDARTKQCSTCKRILSFSEFYVHKNRPTGYTCECKDCRRHRAGYTKFKPIEVDYKLEIKKCSKCKKHLPFSEFSKHASSSTGLMSSCKTCRSISSGHVPRKHTVLLIFFDMVLKECRACGELLPFSDFYRDKNGSGGISPRCKLCHCKVSGHTPRATKPTPIFFDTEMKGCSFCGEVRPFIAFNKNNKGKGGLSARCRSCYNEQVKIRIEEDPNFKLVRLLRSRLYSAIRGGYKSGSAVKDLGCSVEYLREYLEDKFYDRDDKTKMIWELHGTTGWHIDHIKPLSSFDLTDRAQLLQACHYTNLQPLWAEHNWSKNDREGYTHDN